MTPAQEAKDYAAQHGFAIVPNGRRYHVWTAFEGDEHQNHVAEVGGYTAALNAMKRWADTGAKPALRCKGGNCTSNGHTPHSPECVAEHDRVTGDFPFNDPASIERIRQAAADRRTGYYVRVTSRSGNHVADIWCGTMKEAYKACASSTQHYRRIGFVPNTTHSVIFKRG